MKASASTRRSSEGLFECGSTQAGTLELCRHVLILAGLGEGHDHQPPKLSLLSHVWSVLVLVLHRRRQLTHLERRQDKPRQKPRPQRVPPNIDAAWSNRDALQCPPATGIRNVENVLFCAALEIRYVNQAVSHLALWAIPKKRNERRKTRRNRNLCPSRRPHDPQAPIVHQLRGISVTARYSSGGSGPAAVLGVTAADAPDTRTSTSQPLQQYIIVLDPIHLDDD